MAARQVDALGVGLKSQVFSRGFQEAQGFTPHARGREVANQQW